MGSIYNIRLFFYIKNMKEKLFSKTKIKLIEKTVHQYLLAIVGKAWEFGQPL